jgi:hypothetical protein
VLVDVVPTDGTEWSLSGTVLVVLVDEAIGNEASDGSLVGLGLRKL